MGSGRLGYWVGMVGRQGRGRRGRGKGKFGDGKVGRREYSVTGKGRRGQWEEGGWATRTRMARPVGGGMLSDGEEEDEVAERENSVTGKLGDGEGEARPVGGEMLGDGEGEDKVAERENSVTEKRCWALTGVAGRQEEGRCAEQGAGAAWSGKQARGDSGQGCGERVG